MDTASLMCGSERFTERADVTRALATISETVAPLNDALSRLSPSYDSLVVFSHTPQETVAIPLAHSDAPSISSQRHEFRDSAILDRRVVLRGTALGDALRQDINSPDYRPSKINSALPQITYTQPLFSESHQVGAIQHSFTPVEIGSEIADLPDKTELVLLANKNHQELAHTSAEIARLQTLSKELGSLATSLECQEPIAPNAFIIRWDIMGSSAMATDARQTALDAYNNQVHVFLRRLTEAYQQEYALGDDGLNKIYDDQGDGAYIILPTSQSLNPYNADHLTHFRETIAASFLETMHDGLTRIGSYYEKDLSPRLHISADFGYVEPNGIGRLKSGTMFSLAKQKKQ